MLWRNADFSCHAARRGAPTTARGRVRCAVAISTNSLENCGFGGKNKTQSFQKLFVGGYLFVFVEYLGNCRPKIQTKTIINYSSILAIVNRLNWMDDSPPLIFVILLYSPSCFGLETVKEPFGLRVKLPHLVYNTLWSLHAVPFYC